MLKTYKVYAKTNTAKCVTYLESFASDFYASGWTYIDEGWGDRYHHAQANYLDGPIYDDRGIPRYKLVNGAIVKRTQEEMDADFAARPAREPTAEELLLEMAGDHEYRLCLMELGVTENDLQAL